MDAGRGAGNLRFNQGFMPPMAGRSQTGRAEEHASASGVRQTADAPREASPYAKQNRLASFNIQHSLSRLGDNTYKQIRPHEPEYYLRPVRNNSAIKEALSNLQAHKDKVEAFCKEIDAGNWEKVSHFYMEEAYPDREDLHDIQTKDLLFFAFAAGRISRMEFGTAHMVLNLKEQFQEEISPTYHGIANGVRTSMTLPSIWQDVEMHRIFEEGGQNLTQEADSYLIQIVGNLQKWPKIFGTHDEDTLFNKLEQAFRQVPTNMQVFYKVPNHGSNPEDFWQKNLCSFQMPLAAAPDLDGGGAKEVNEYFYSPSSALLHEFCKLLREPAVQPTICLGTTGVRQLAEMHREGFHPVTVLDERIKSNYLTPHGHPSGVLISSMHDEHFHCMAGTRYTPEQREMVCRTLPSAIERAANKAGPAEQVFAERFIVELADMAALYPEKMAPQDFLQEALMRSFAVMDVQPSRREREVFREDPRESLLRLLDFTQACLDEIKSTRVARGGLQRTLGEEREWGKVEALISDKYATHVLGL